MSKVSGPVWAALAGVIAAGSSGCAVDRPALDSPELEARRTAFIRHQQEDWGNLATKTVRRMKSELDAWEASGRSGAPPCFDILILSGGGDYGAFGAGFLEGWQSVTEPELKLPEFDVVTGVSTGALIAPFAFIGDSDSLKQVERLYCEPSKDLALMRGLFFFLPWQQSFMDTKGLRRDIERAVSPAVIARIAEGSREGRVLAIGTTNLDLGVLQPFRLTLESERAVETGDCRRVHDILMASAAIPAAFPPVVIDDTLFVDGGTTSNILFSAEMRAPGAALSRWRETYPGTQLPKMRYWVIVNNQLGLQPQVVQPKWPSITAASVSTAIRSSTIGSLRQVDLLIELLREVDGVDAELRYVAIPDAWRPPKPGTFVKETMVSLVELGIRMGRDPGNWQTGLGHRPKGAELSPKMPTAREAPE